MKIQYGEGKTKYGPGVDIHLDGDEVARAIMAWLVAHGVHVEGPRTIQVNACLCDSGRVYVDPSGFVIDADGRKHSGRGPSQEKCCHEILKPCMEFGRVEYCCVSCGELVESGDGE